MTTQSKDFILYNKVNRFEEYIRDNIAINIPSIHRDLRIHLLDECYNLKRNLFEAQFNKGNIRSKYINEMIVTISLINSIFDSIIKYIPSKKKSLISAIGLLTEIKNMTYAWKAGIQYE